MSEREGRGEKRRKEARDSALSFPETAEALLLLCTRQPAMYLVPNQCPTKRTKIKYPNT